MSTIQSTSKFTDYRLQRDAHNWIVQGFQAGGEVITRGKFVGQEKKAKWVDICYFPSIMHAANRMLELFISDGTEEQINQAVELKLVIEDGLARVEKIVHEAIREQAKGKQN